MSWSKTRKSLSKLRCLQIRGERVRPVRDSRNSEVREACERSGDELLRFLGLLEIEGRDSTTGDSLEWDARNSSVGIDCFGSRFCRADFLGAFGFFTFSVFISGALFSFFVFFLCLLLCFRFFSFFKDEPIFSSMQQRRKAESRLNI